VQLGHIASSTKNVVVEKFLFRSELHAKAKTTMRELRHRPLLHLARDAQAELMAGARDGEPVRGLTHGFYKYPARFSPSFARAAIEIFTRPGDLVVDNHVGGGTTLVEALLSGGTPSALTSVRLPNSWQP
jgi:DNA methylase